MRNLSCILAHNADDTMAALQTLHQMVRHLCSCVDGQCLLHWVKSLPDTIKSDFWQVKAVKCLDKDSAGWSVLKFLNDLLDYWPGDARMVVCAKRYSRSLTI